MARKAGTLVLLFTGKSYDYLTCLAGGIFTTKDKAFMANRPFRRQLVLYNGTNLTQAEIIPVLLSTYPQVVVPTSIDQLVSRLIDRARTIRDWIASGNKRKTK
jgi:hypothetical protein